MDKRHLSLMLVGGSAALVAGATGYLDPRLMTNKGAIPHWRLASVQAIPQNRVLPGLGPFKLLFAATSTALFAATLPLSYRLEQAELNAHEETQFSRELQRRRLIIQSESELQHLAMASEKRLQAGAVVEEAIAEMQAAERYTGVTGIPVDVTAEPVSEEKPKTKAEQPEKSNPEPTEPSDAPAQPTSDEVPLPHLVANYDGHLLIACRTGAGKTSTILSCMSQVMEQTEGRAEFHVIDPKQSLWGGLENISDNDIPRVVYLELDNPGSVMKAIAKLDQLRTKLAQRSQERKAKQIAGEAYAPPPCILVIDEETYLLGLAKEYEAIRAAEKDKRKYRDEICGRMNGFAFAGREDQVRLWIVGQSHFVQDAGFNGAVRDNFAVVAQGRLGNYQSIERAISDAYLIPRKSDRDRLDDRLEQMKKTVPSDQPIIFTSLGGYQLGVLPNFEGIKARQIFKTHNSDQP